MIFPPSRTAASRRRCCTTARRPPSQGWYLNTRREQFNDPRVREAIGLAFDFEWTNKNVMYSSYKRIISFFPNTDMEAKGKPGPDELTLLEPFRDKLPASVFGDPYTPPRQRRFGQRPHAAQARLRSLALGGLQARRRRR